MPKSSLRVFIKSSVLIVLLCMQGACQKEQAKEETSTFSPGVIVPDNLDGLNLSIVSPSLSEKQYLPKEYGGPADRNDFAFCIKTRRESFLTEIYTEEYYDAISNYKLPRLESLSKIVNTDPSIGKDYYAPIFYDCEIKADITITADCQLFGIPSGKDLSEHCKVIAVDPYSHYVCRYDNLERRAVWEKGMPLNQYLAEGNALPSMHEYVVFAFDAVPDDMPLVFTLFISIPICYTSWDAFPWTSRNGKTLLSSERTITASTEVSF